MKNGEKIATIMGRFYAMDRNKIWERTRVAYDAMVLGQGQCTAASAEEAVEQSYNRGETDEYICPTVILENGQPVTRIRDNDAIFFFNARSDRARQLTKAFVQRENFEAHNAGVWHREHLPENIRFVAMTDFCPDLPGTLTAFPSPEIDWALAKAIGDAYRQLYISETEKYAHVTYFVNGGYAQPINGEKRELVASGNVYSYAKRPDMHAKELTNKIISYIKSDKYNFICINYPNADMVGHTGNFAAAERAVATLDREVGRLARAVLQLGGQLLIVADHGNAEEMVNLKTGEIWTEHTTNPVPCILVRKDAQRIQLKKGKLADVAPTLLKLMGREKPKEMTGQSLF